MSESIIKVPLKLTTPLFEDKTVSSTKVETVPHAALKVGMDSANAAIVDTWRERGEKAAVQAMFTGAGGERLSYAEMRSRYG